MIFSAISESEQKANFQVYETIFCNRYKAIRMKVMYVAKYYTRNIVKK